MIEFSREPLQVLEDNFHLTRKHWDEIMRTTQPLDMHWVLYRFLEKTQNLVCFYARDKGKVIGYALFMLQPDLHSKNIKTASNDAIFIEKEHRKGWMGKKFIRYCDEQLQTMNIQLIAWQVTTQVDYSPLLKSLGYTKFSTVYAREIGG